MQTVKNPIARFFIYLVLSIFVLTTSVPFVWTLLQSLKTLRQANSRTPLFIFKPTGESYINLWFRSKPEHLSALLFGFVAASLAVILIALFLSRRGVSKIAIIALVVCGFSLIFWATK